MSTVLWKNTRSSTPSVVSNARCGCRSPGRRRTSRTTWLSHLASATTKVALSSHIRPHGHPHPDVVNAITQANFQAFRTDLQSHLTFSTDGTTVDVQYSHI